MVNWWFGILRVPLSNNPFHKCNPEVQTTGPQTTNLPLAEAPHQQKNISTTSTLKSRGEMTSCNGNISKNKMEGASTRCLKQPNKKRISQIESIPEVRVATENTTLAN